MSTHSHRQAVEIPGLFAKPVAAYFDAEHVSSDAGALLLRRADQRLGLLKKLAACIDDARDHRRSSHTVEQMFTQRVYGLALGYEDCNDAAKIGRDPLLKMCASRSPSDDSRLASQPTLCRFENAVTAKETAAIQSQIAATVTRACRKRYGKHVKQIVIDLDPTDDPAFGAQQLTFFNAYYDNNCYLPLMGFMSFDGAPEQHLFMAMLRPGNVPATAAAHEALEDFVPCLRELWPRAQIVVRLDGAYATPETFATLERLKAKYIVNMGENSVLREKAKPFLDLAWRTFLSEQTRASVFGETRYAAKRWNGTERRVVIKSEAGCDCDLKPWTNQRFIVTNLSWSPERIYDFYCLRADAENRIKEMKLDLASGRTSCTSFAANQLRLSMSAAAFVLMQELRLDAIEAGIPRATVSTFRSKLLKVAVRVVETVRRFVLHLPAHYPWRDAFARLVAT
jgi:hypothetical protein